MLMLETWGEMGESMSYFSPGSSNTSTRARTHSPGLGSSRHLSVCLSPGAASQTSYKWPFLVYHSCTTTQGAAETRELKLHFVQSPGAVVSALPDEILSSRAEKEQTGVGLLRWKSAVMCNEKVSFTCLLSEPKVIREVTPTAKDRSKEQS